MEILIPFIVFIFFVIGRVSSINKKSWATLSTLFGWKQEQPFLLTGLHKGRKVVVQRKKYANYMLTEMLLDAPADWPHGVMISRKDAIGLFLDEHSYRHEKIKTDNARFDRIYDVFGTSLTSKVCTYFLQMNTLRFVSFSETGIKFVFINTAAPKPEVVSQLLSLTSAITRIVIANHVPKTKKAPPKKKSRKRSKKKESSLFDTPVSLGFSSMSPQESSHTISSFDEIKNERSAHKSLPDTTIPHVEVISSASEDGLFQEIFAQLSRFGITSKEREDLLSKHSFEFINCTIENVQPLFELGLTAEFRGGARLFGSSDGVPIVVNITKSFKDQLQSIKPKSMIRIPVEVVKWNSLEKRLIFQMRLE